MNERKKIAVIFPGQGKEYKGISIRPEIAQCRESLGGFRLLTSLVQLDEFDTYFYGSSFGQYPAGVAAGVYTEPEGELLITTRADLIQKDEERRVARGQHRTGMVVILGQRIEVIRGLVSRSSEAYRSIISQYGNKEPSELHHTNINGETSHVVAGDRPFLETLIEFFGQARAKILPIDGMYHAKSRERVSIEYASDVDKLGIQFRIPRYPIISSTEPRVLQTGEQVHEEQVAQIYRPVDTLVAVALMQAEGIEILFDVGPGQFANQVLKKNNPAFRVISLDADQRKTGLNELPLEVIKSFLANLRGSQSPPRNP